VTSSTPKRRRIQIKATRVSSSAAPLQNKEGLEISDDAHGGTEREAERNEDGDASL